MIKRCYIAIIVLLNDHTKVCILIILLDFLHVYQLYL